MPPKLEGLSDQRQEVHTGIRNVLREFSITDWVRNANGVFQSKVQSNTTSYHKRLASGKARTKRVSLATTPDNKDAVLSPHVQTEPDVAPVISGSTTTKDDKKRKAGSKLIECRKASKANLPDVADAIGDIKDEEAEDVFADEFFGEFPLCYNQPSLFTSTVYSANLQQCTCGAKAVFQERVRSQQENQQEDWSITQRYHYPICSYHRLS
jgi:hypothetical protein